MPGNTALFVVLLAIALHRGRSPADSTREPRRARHTLMRIAFDLDGVLADLHGAFAASGTEAVSGARSRRVLREPEVGSSPPIADTRSAESIVPPPKPMAELPLTSRQNDAVWKALADMPDFWEIVERDRVRHDPPAGRAGRRASLGGAVHHQPSALGGPDRAATEPALARAARVFRCPASYVVQGSRGLIAKALQIDLVIDDRPENCLDVVLESQAGAILVWRGHRESVPGSARRMGIAVVHSVTEALDAIVKIEQPDEPTGLLDRLRTLFGLRTSRPAGSS